MNLNQINAELKELKIGVAVEIRGGKVALRAILPPKSSSRRSAPYQQRISLGISANEQGLIRAKAEAIKLGGLLACKEFDWSLYIPNDKLTCGEWCQRFKRDYFCRRADTPQAKTTYRCSYQQIFNKLPQNRRLTPTVIKKTLLSIRPDTRQRNRGTIALSKLARFAGIDIDLSSYKGLYSQKSVKPRKLISDDELIAAAQSIPNGQWRNLVLMLITYGLRPHEAFYCDFKDAPLLHITDGKTGPRHIAPLYPEWVEKFDLVNAALPPGGNGFLYRDFSALGDRVTTQFRRYGISFTSYVPRHCYARRSKEFNITAIDAAKMMGHSLQQHFRSYHHHYAKDEVVRVTEMIDRDSNRPRPPVVD